MSKNKTCKSCADPSRLNKVGGQAVIEGIMMKAGARTVTTCRKEDGSIIVNDATFTSVRRKHKILNIPILRGVINFVEMMILSVKTMNVSADALGIEEEESKANDWLEKHIGIGLTSVITVVGTILGIVLSLALFMYLPNLVSSLINKYVAKGSLGLWTAAIEGVVKMGILISYLSLVSLVPDIKRTFMYHGAEHKSIACFEAGGELTPQNAKNFTRFHPRCGTSFMFFMILLGIFAGLLIKTILPNATTFKYTAIRLLILPLVIGIGYEFIMLAGKRDNFITRFLSAPGLWVQRITTKEPTEDMLEVAIISIKCALRDDFPEFKQFFDERPWENSKEAIADEPVLTETQQNCEPFEVDINRDTPTEEDKNETL